MDCRPESGKQDQQQWAQAGFTLIEVLVAIAILGVVMAAMTSAFLANASLNTQVDRRAEAIRIGEETLERYRQGTNYSTLSTSVPIVQNISRRGQTYVVTSTFCSSDRSTELQTQMPCSTSAVYIDIAVKQNDKSLYSASTYYTAFGTANDE